MKTNWLSLSGMNPLKPMPWQKILEVCKGSTKGICLIRHVRHSIIAGEFISLASRPKKAVIIKNDDGREHPCPQKMIADIKFVPLDVWDRAKRLLDTEEGRIVARVILNDQAMKGVRTWP